MIAPASPPRAGRRRRPRRRAVLGCAATLLLLAASYAFVRAPRSLPVPEEIFPGEGRIRALEVPRGVIGEVDRVLAAATELIPPHAELLGGIEVPPIALRPLRRAGPWRIALWDAPDGRWALFVGGEGYGALRGTLLRAVAARSAGGGPEVVAAGGGLLIGEDAALIAECAQRAGDSPRRRIPRDGIRVWCDDAERGAAIELWWTTEGDEDRLLERWRGRDGALDWRSWLSERGVEVERISDGESERRWALHGARAALTELLGSLQRW